VATREKKNTIQPEHVMTALKELGFTGFEAEVALAWEQHKEEAKSVLLETALSLASCLCILRLIQIKNV
jgi:Holliday junction resolvasome RuvABC DNA-binding subunit